MVTVKMPRADWELNLAMLEEYYRIYQGIGVQHLIKEIESQVYSQEY